MTKFNVSSNLARCSFKNHFIGGNIIIIVLEDIVFIDESDFQRKMIEDEIGLLHRKITIAKRLRCFSIYDSFSFWFWGEADGKLSFRGINNSGIARMFVSAQTRLFLQCLRIVFLKTLTLRFPNGCRFYNCIAIGITFFGN